ncbi:hypothetical protein WNY37_01730 [Henriciella sp. AS95]|uniref:hypothetical protein n=1 Tax=Henriciella sp. AS95 TaxID=3135782 RepID=UPI00317138B5
MTILMLIAAALLLLSAAFFFGPMLVAYGSHGARELVRHPQAHFAAMTIITALLVIVFYDPSASALISEDEAVQVVLRT